MYFHNSILLSLTAFATSVLATPFEKHVPSVVRRVPDLVKRVNHGPSAYPYEQEFLNEFQWHGWDVNDQGQRADALKIHNAYNDWTTMIRWFDASNAQDVKNGLERMVVQGNFPQPNDLMKGLICEHDDIRQKCRPRHNAYIVISKGQVHFCPDGVAKRNAADLQCSDLDGFASAKMRSVASTMLHECTHWTQIGDAALNQHIKDLASGASDCFNLSPSDKLINAQNYAFLAAEAYYKVKGCTFSDPPPGTADVDDIDDEVSVSPASFTGGWCGMHVTQYQKNEPGDSSTSNSPDYILSVCIYDANQVLLNQDPGQKGCGQFVALNGQAQAIDTALPHLMYVTVGAVDNDPLLFTYGDQD